MNCDEQDESPKATKAVLSVDVRSQLGLATVFFFLRTSPCGRNQAGCLMQSAIFLKAVAPVILFEGTMELLGGRLW